MASIAEMIGKETCKELTEAKHRIDRDLAERYGQIGEAQGMAVGPGICIAAGLILERRQWHG